MTRLQFENEAFDFDPICALAFLNLQRHRDVSPLEFDEAAAHVDNLLCLVKAIATGVEEWNHRDVFVARERSEWAEQHLNQLFELAKMPYWFERKEHLKRLQLPDSGSSPEICQEAQRRLDEGKNMLRDMFVEIKKIRGRLQEYQVLLGRSMPSLTIAEKKKRNKTKREEQPSKDSVHTTDSNNLI